MPVPPRKSQSLDTQRVAIDLVRAPQTCPCTAGTPQRAEGSGQWSQPVLAADWPGNVPPIDLPPVTKAHLQQKGVLSPHE